jgi:hypothetical protein
MHRTVATLYKLAEALRAIHFARQAEGKPLPLVSVVNHENGYTLIVTER